MVPIRQTLSAAGAGTPIVMDYRARNTNTTVHVKPNGSTVALQMTYDDPFAATWNPSTAEWIGVTLDGNGSATFASNPCAIRGNVSAYVAPVSVIVISDLAPMG